MDSLTDLRVIDSVSNFAAGAETTRQDRADALPCPVVPAEAPMAMPCQALDLVFSRGLGRLVTRLAQGA